MEALLASPVGTIKKVRSAYEFAAYAHKNQKRKTGEPYIVHPVNVALIVAEVMGLGPNSVMAALCHDVCEDCPYTIDEIRERFGDDVAFLVCVVTKQKKEHYNQSKQIDNFRQILSSVEYDVRAILIKLADRLDNMQTLDVKSLNSQMRISSETEYFYAPLANRLGLYEVKTELEHGDYIVAVDFEENEQFMFPVRISIRGVDRHHLLRDVIACITEQQNLSISKLVTETKDRIVETMVDFEVHSAEELYQAIDNIAKIKNVDEVSRCIL